MSTHYATLGVAETATIEDIHQARLRLVRENNPNRLTGHAKKKAEDRLVVINAAYNVLKNPERRREYDATLPPTAKPRTSRSGSSAPPLPAPPLPAPPAPPKPPQPKPGWPKPEWPELGWSTPELLRVGIPARLVYALKWLGYLLLVFLVFLWVVLKWLLLVSVKALWWFLRWLRRLMGRFIQWMNEPREKE